MRAYVITIKGLKPSETIAKRCIESAELVGIKVKSFPAFTPKDDPVARFKDRQLPLHNFVADSEKYSRYENVLSCFLSHYTLWQQCAAFNEEVMILEHDAVFTNSVPAFNYNKCITIGQPSYGKFNTPTGLGVQPLQHKPYFGGAHAYLLKPEGANELMEHAKIYAGPVDIFLSLKNFPWLQELYPWPVECRDSFTTVQNETGCLAKHNYKNRNFDIVSV